MTDINIDYRSEEFWGSEALSVKLAQKRAAKPSAVLICGMCYEEDGEICVMEGAEA